MDYTILNLGADQPEPQPGLPVGSDAPRKMIGGLTTAHAHYLTGRYRDCFAECLATVEGALMDLSDEHGWPAKNTETVRWLTTRCVSEHWIPAFAESPLAFLQTYLESGAFTNDEQAALGGCDTALAGYALHLSAVTLLLLQDARRPGASTQSSASPMGLMSGPSDDHVRLPGSPTEPQRGAA